MKKGVLIMVAGLAFACWVKADLSAPSNSLGNASVYGYLLVWSEVPEWADYGDGLKLPVRFAFNSGRQNDSPYLGRSFWVPLAEAKAYPYSEKLMRVELICGQTIYLRKNLKNLTQYSTEDGKTTGVLDGNKFILTESDGWITRYRDGKIWQAQNAQGRVLVWYYRGNIATEIKEERTGNSAFKVEYGTNGQPKGFSVNGRLYSFELGQKPRVEMVEGKRVVGAMDTALNVWNYPDGKKETYVFSVTQAVEPTLTVTDKEGVVKNYQWDAKTGWIVSDGDWKYKIENNGQLPKLRRYNDKGQEEFVIVDNRSGVYQQKGIEEGTKITEVFRTPGPLYGKVRKIENVLADGTKKTVYQASYDEKSKLLRTAVMDARGYIKNYQYGPDGKEIAVTVTKPNTSELALKLKTQEQKILEKIAQASNGSIKEYALQELGLFYIQEMGEPDKALALLSQITNRRHRFSLQFLSIHDDFKANHQQKAAKLEKLLEEYPEPENQRILQTVINILKNGKV